MYQSIIQLDNKLPDEKIQEITKLIDAAFDNRCGKVINSSNNPYILKYEGSKKDYPCMDISQIELITNSPEVLNYIVAWNTEILSGSDRNALRQSRLADEYASMCEDD